MAYNGAMDHASSPPQGTGQLLLSLFEATAGETGDDFFRALAEHLAELLEARHAWVAEILPCGKRARTLAYWAKGRFVDAFEYDLAHTPCESVLSGDIVQIPEKLFQQYPRNKTLARLRLESYFGIPLVSRDGEVLGHAAATNSEPMVEKSRDYSTFKVFASRATAELERRRSDVALAGVRSKLMQAEKLAALGKLTAGVAHEINTPIGVIRSNADLAKRALSKLREVLARDAGNVDVEKYLTAIQGATEASSGASGRIGDIVENLKRFTRVDTAAYQLTDIHEGIDSTLALLKPDLSAGVKIDKRYGEVPRIQSHPAELNQVFMTLLQNASDAIDGEGTITITTASGEEKIYIAIADNGRGIPEEQMSSLFDIGFSAKGARVGMSIGLPVAYHIIKNHDGEITVAPNEAGGTLFEITLPRAPTKEN